MSPPPGPSWPVQHPPTSRGPKRPLILMVLSAVSVAILSAAVVFAGVRMSGAAEEPATESATAYDHRGSQEPPAERPDGMDPGNEDNAKPEPCEVLSQEVVAEVVPDAAAIPIAPQQESPLCRWTTMIRPDPIVQRTVEVRIAEPDQLETWLTERRQAVEDADAWNVEDVPDIAAGFAGATRIDGFEARGVAEGVFGHGDLAFVIRIDGWQIDPDYDPMEFDDILEDPEARLPVDPERLRPLMHDLMHDAATTPESSGPYREPTLQPTEFPDEEPPSTRCAGLSAELVQRLVAVNTDPSADDNDDPGCLLRERQQEPGPDREQSREIMIDVEEFDQPGAAAAEFETTMNTQTYAPGSVPWVQVATVRELPELGDQAMMLAGRATTIATGTVPEEAIAMVVVRRDATLYTVTYRGDQYADGAESFLDEEPPVPMPLDDAEDGVLEVARAYLS